MNGELRDKLGLAAIVVLDAIPVVALITLESALNWLRSLPFFGRSLHQADSVIAAAGYGVLVIVATGSTSHLARRTLQQVLGPNTQMGPQIRIAITLLLGLALAATAYVLNEGPSPSAQGNIGMAGTMESRTMEGGEAAKPDSGQQLSVIFRLRRPIRGINQKAQKFVVRCHVTEIDLRTPVASATFKTFGLILDGKECPGYQVLNGELRLIVDRQSLGPGSHALIVRETDKRSGRSDKPTTFKFEIEDELSEECLD